MYKVAVEKTDANKITPVKGDTLESIAASNKCEPGTTWQHLALYNWGSIDPFELNRALIELVGCSKVDEAAPEKSLIDPDLGTTKVLHAPKAWTPPAALPVEQTHTLKIRRRHPAPAAVFKKLDPWFIPETEACDIEWRVEGVKERADKVDYDVYASNYFKATPTVTDRFASFAYAAVDVPIFQKRAHTAFTERMTHAIADWKGESEATDGILKPRANKKRHIDVACSPYTVLVRYYKADADKDARVVFKTFWPRFKKVFKDKADTVGIDGAPTGLKEKTDAALKAARELEAAVAKAKTAVTESTEAIERAALRAHSAAKLAAKVVTDLATAKTATDKAKNDIVTARTALGTLTTAKNNLQADSTNVGLQNAKSTAQSDFTTKKGTAQTSARDAQQKANNVNKQARPLSQATGLTKAAAARAVTLATAAQTSATAATTAAGAAKTKADEAKSAIATADKAPDALKDAAKAAVERIDAAKVLADELTALATAAVTTAGTLRNDANTAATAGNNALTPVNNYFKAVDNADDKIRDNSNWSTKENSATEAVTKHGIAKTRTDTVKTNADTSLTSATAARLDGEKLMRGVAKLSEGVGGVVKLTDTTDDNVVFDASLEVKWKVEKTDKIKHGQLLIVDKDGKALFRKPLAAADLAKDTEKSCKPGDDDQAKYWLDEKNKLQLCLSGMPYRVQMQVHSGWDEDDGVALAAMHTEVRLWAHREAGLHADPVDDVSSLRFAFAPLRPEKDPPASGGNEWYRMKLAEAGYYPGPVNELAPGNATEPFKVALREFQRSFPAEEAAPFSRINSTGAINPETTTVLARTDTADKNHQKAVDVKTETQATVDAVARAKTAADKAVDEAVLAQTAAGNAVTLAGEAVTLAQQVAGDAAAADAAAKQAKQAVDSAVSADPQGAAEALMLAVNAANAAATTANTAAQSASVASTKATAAKDAGGTAFDESAKAKASSGALKTDTDDAAKKALGAQNKAVSEAAPSTVKTPVDNCKTQSTTTDTAADTSKTASGNAGTALATARDKGVTGADSAAQGLTSANTAKADADALVQGLANNPVAQAAAVAVQAETAAGLAKTAADKTLLDLQALKTAAEQAKTAADTAKTEADNAKVSVATLVDSAKLANDAAEVERKDKKDTKDKVDKIYREAFPIFGNTQGRADYTLDAAKPLFADKSNTLILWVDDCHYYTDDNPQPVIPGLWMENYRGGMEIANARVTKDAESIPRPWVPVEVQLPLLGKGQTLECTGNPPDVTDAMRRAIGPLRVDWTFDELPPETDNIQDAPTGHASSIAELARAIVLKSKTAATVTAAGQVKTAITPVVTHSDVAKTKQGEAETLSGEADTLAKKAAADIAAAQVAAAKAGVDAAKAAGPNASPHDKQLAKASIDSAAQLAATAVQSANDAAVKATAAKTAAGELATEVTATKAELATCVSRLDATKTAHNDADVAAGIAQSTGTVMAAMNDVKEALETVTEACTGVKKDADDTDAAKCSTEAATAETAALLAKTNAEALQAAIDLAKGGADTDAWGVANTHAGGRVGQGRHG
jgi:hypothetical protein